MKLIKIFIALITVVSFSIAAQSDSTSQKKVINDSVPPKAISTVESSKATTGMFPKTRTTWTSIKDLFK